MSTKTMAVMARGYRSIVGSALRRRRARHNDNGPVGSVLPAAAGRLGSHSWQPTWTDETGRRPRTSSPSPGAGGEGGGPGAASSPEPAAVPAPPPVPPPSNWAFARDWNDALARRPQAVLAAFLSAQSATWLGWYGVLSSAFDPGSFPPSLAAGYAVARLTRKLRQPANAALAAGMLKIFPFLGEAKVTPLVTGFAMGKDDRSRLAKAWSTVEERAPAVASAADAAARGVKWLEGPVDKYGLSFYLSSRISGVATVGASAYFVGQGVDVGAILSEWGLGEGAGGAAGAAAAAAIGNAFLVPVHFGAAVYGVRALEGLAERVSRDVVEAKAEAEKDFRPTMGDGEEHNDDDRKQNNGDAESERERIADGMMRMAMVLLLSCAMVMSLYTLRLVGETATNPKSGVDDEGDDQKTKGVPSR